MGIVAAAARPPRRIKVRGGSLGWYLCWAVVFADIGTSVYYVPGILYGPFRNQAAIFLGLTLVVFLLLTIKYAEVSWRYPEGGGVVTVASRALHPFAGLLGGLFIMVDYYLTAAISALSGIQYLAVIVPALHPTSATLIVTILVLVALGTLNVLGIKESAAASAVFASLAAIGQLLVVLAVAVQLGPAGIVDTFRALGRGPHLTPLTLIVGYGAAFLAFSGLESISQLAPAMKEPRRRIARQAMVAVVVTICLTSPLLTLWSTTLLGPGNDPNQFISLLGMHVAGPALGDYVAISGALLLIFASNTAIIGGYHVLIALSRMGFMPRALETRNRWRGTPHVAILGVVLLPLVVVALSKADTTTLGDLYAFGLLGAFILTCLALDIVRWHEHEQRPGSWSPRAVIAYAVGVLTTVLVAIAWLTNLVSKPLATEFGGGLTVLGLIIGLVTYAVGRQQAPVVFPFLHRPGVPIVPIANARQMPPCELLVILPHDLQGIEALLEVVRREAVGRPVVFLYRGDQPDGRHPELLEVADPYLKDRAAQAAFARAERVARKVTRDRRYVYVPGGVRREAVADVWKTLRARETLVVDGDQNVLPPVAIDRVRRTYQDGIPVLHLVSGRVRQAMGSA
jgi:amino acid transporter